MAGGWASALGAAILGGNQGYRQAKEFDAENKLRLLNAAILKKNLDDIDATRARAKAEDIYKLSPEEAFNNPEFIRLRQAGGVPVNVSPTAPLDIQRFRAQAVENPDNVGAAPTEGQAAAQLGVSPTTGAVLPPELQFGVRKREKEMQQLDTQMQMLKNLTGDIPPAGGPAAVPGGPAGVTGAAGGALYDPADVRRRMMMKIGLNVDPASIYGPVQKTPAQIKQQERASVEAKPLSANAQNAVNEMLQWGPVYRSVIDELQNNKMYDSANPQVGNSMFRDAMPMLWQRLKYAAGKNPDAPYGQLIQSTEMANSNFLGALLHGIRNPEIIAGFKQHFPSTWGGTTAQMGDRASSLVAAIPARVQALYAAEGKDVPPEVMARAQAMAKGLTPNATIMSMLASETPLKATVPAGGPAAQMPPQTAAHAQPAAPPQPAGPKAPTAPQGGKAISLSEVQSIASAKKLDPNKLMTQLKAEGWTVTK